MCSLEKMSVFLAVYAGVPRHMSCQPKNRYFWMWAPLIMQCAIHYRYNFYSSNFKLCAKKLFFEYYLTNITKSSNKGFILLVHY